MQIRTYHPGDEQGFLKLDNLVETHPWNRRNLANWQWKYFGPNPAGKSIVAVAEHNGEIISCFAALPMKYWIYQKEIIGSHSIAMIVHPDWQNKGLIKFVADKLFEEIRARQWPFTYGYPNDNAYNLHVQYLGYENIALQPLMQRLMTEDHYRRQFSADLEFREIINFDQTFTDLFDRHKYQFKAIVVRDADWLNWRYHDRPDVPYYCFGAWKAGQLVGYTVLKLYQEADIRRGHYLDIFCDQEKPEIGSFLVQKGLDFFKKENCSEVNLWSQGSRFWQHILSDYGFSKISERPLICRFNLEREKYKSILTPADWYFCMGDTLEIY